MSRNESLEQATQENRQNQGIDQLKNTIELIKTDPQSRRILLTDYNPLQAEQGVLYPCHSLIIQFYVREETYLDMFCYNRSQDLFLGTPFNIASTALLLCIIAKMTGLQAGKLHMSLGDVHIYKEHQEIVKTQLARPRYPFPKLICPEIVNLEALYRVTSDQFSIVDYKSHEALKTEMKA